METTPAVPWQPDLGDGRYRNPVLFADYSDPDVIRVGNDYWLTASSFCHAPGLPILHSRDLVNWSLVNHALPALSAAPGVPPGHFAVPRHGAGVWAPALRHHAGKFHLYYPDPDFGIYLVTADDPRGTWSAPMLVKAGRGLIDPCPFWDDDGRGYLVHAWARSRSGRHNLLQLHELSADGTHVVDGDGEVLIDENTSGRGFHTLEGPKLYKRAGSYWIFAPVGGVATGSQAVYRAPSIRGPYTARIVLAQGHTAINGPHQGAWVDTPAGEHWFFHFQDRGPFGRVVHLQPLVWRDDGWPALGTGALTGALTGEPVLAHAKPHLPPAPTAAPPTSDAFGGTVLGRQWQWPADPQPSWWSLTHRPGWLRLNAPPGPAAGLAAAPNLLLQKFPAPAFTVTVRLDATGTAVGDETGLVIFGRDYAWIGLQRTPAGLRLVHIVHLAAHGTPVPAPAVALAGASSEIFLRVTVDTDAQCHFAFSADGAAFQPCGKPFCAVPSTWVGAKVGLFCHAPGASAAGGHADFAAFTVTPA